MRHLLRVALAFVRRDLQDLASYRMALVLQLGASLLTLASLYYLARSIEARAAPGTAPGNLLGFWIWGVLLVGLQHALISALPRQIRLAQLAGTWEAFLATPTPAWMIVSCAPLFQIVRAVVGIALLVGSSCVFFELSLARAQLTSLLIVLLLASLTFVGLGILAGAMVMLSRRGDPVAGVVSGLSTLASGVLYSPDVLPGWLAQLGRWMPLTHALSATRQAALGGATLEAIAPELGRLLLWVLVSLPVSTVLFVWAFRRARRDGSLSHY